VSRMEEGKDVNSRYVLNLQLGQHHFVSRMVEENDVSIQTARNRHWEQQVFVLPTEVVANACMKTVKRRLVAARNIVFSMGEDEDVRRMDVIKEHKVLLSIVSNMVAKK